MDERELSRRLRAEIDAIAVMEPAPARRRPLRRALPLLAAGAAVLVLALVAGRLLSVLREDRANVAAPTSTAVPTTPLPSGLDVRPVGVPFAVLTPRDGWREPLPGISDRPGIILVTSREDVALLLRAPGGKIADPELGALLDRVDYGRQIVVAVFAGTKPCLGHEIVVNEVLLGRRFAQLEVRTRQSGPGPSDVCLMAVSYPMQLVAVDRGTFMPRAGSIVTLADELGTPLATTRWCEAATDCVHDVLGTSTAAQLRAVARTIEGDPIATTALVRGSGMSKVVRDARADRFGEQRVFVYLCAGVHVAGPGSGTPLVFGACEGDGDSTTFP